MAISDRLGKSDQTPTGGLPTPTPELKQVFHPKSGGWITKGVAPGEQAKTPDGPNTGANGVAKGSK